MQQIKVSIELLHQGKAVVCHKCGKDIFQVYFKVIKISKLIPENKTRQDLYIDQPVKRCVSCKHVLQVRDIEGGNGQKENSK